MYRFRIKCGMTKNKMLIGIDGFEVSISQRVGVGRLAVEIIKNLEKVDRENEYRIYLPQPPQPDLPDERKHWQYKVLPFHRLWSQLSLPLFLFLDQAKPDVFLSPTHYAPRFSPSPRVVFILDLSFLYFPEMFKKTDLYKLKNWTKYSVIKAKRVIAISRSTRDDIIRYYQIEPEKVVVSYPGVHLAMDKKMVTLRTLNNMESTEKIKKKYGIEGDYILYVGTLQPRKNLVRLIEAFKKLKAQNSKRKTTIKNLKLVIAGKKGWMYEEIFEKVKELKLENQVIFTGYVSDRDLPALYQGSQCLVLVSLYEGFGLPVLEAMSLGVPVVASNVSSLPEIVGEAGVLVDQESVEDIAQGIKKVLSFSLGERKKIIEKGLEQAKKFSWEKCAKETLKVLMEVANKNV